MNAWDLLRAFNAPWVVTREEIISCISSLASKLMRTEDELEKVTRERDSLLKSNDQLVREIAELRRDALRYRWLRHGDNDELVIRHLHFGIYSPYLPRNEVLDAEIDAAITSESGSDQEYELDQGLVIPGATE